MSAIMHEQDKAAVSICCRGFDCLGAADEGFVRSA